jgi:putative DNA primase/helicase
MAKKPKYNAAQAVLDNLPPPPEGEAHDYWEKNLELTEKQRVVSSLRNAFLILSRDPAWDGVLAFDEFSNQVVKRKVPPFAGGEAGPWGDVDDLRTAIWLSHHYRFNPDKRVVMGAVVAVANDRRFHPVRDYFARVKWDGKDRLPTWLHTYLGAEASEYTRAVGLKFMIGAVARVMRPGCKMDTVLILEGEQGRWKSTALATLAGEWFGDTPFTIGDKDAYLVIRGNIIYELAELDGFSRAESSRAKAFFSSPYDTFVPKYVAWATKVPRQCVFAGTVNHGTYLRDTTGNRRYWPVKIERADIAALAAERDQLWAEAVHRYGQGERWWVEPDEREIFQRQQELRYVGDAYEDVLRDGLLGKTEVTMQQVLDDVLKLDKSKWTHAEQTRVGNVLHAIGWEKCDRGSTARPRFVYRLRERVPGEEG